MYSPPAPLESAVATPTFSQKRARLVDQRHTTYYPGPPSTPVTPTTILPPPPGIRPPPRRPPPPAFPRGLFVLPNPKTVLPPTKRKITEDIIVQMPYPLNPLNPLAMMESLINRPLPCQTPVPSLPHPLSTPIASPLVGSPQQSHVLPTVSWDQIPIQVQSSFVPRPAKETEEASTAENVTMPEDLTVKQEPTESPGESTPREGSKEDLREESAKALLQAFLVSKGSERIESESMEELQVTTTVKDTDQTEIKEVVG